MNITPEQGSKLEKAGQEWLCFLCVAKEKGTTPIFTTEYKRDSDDEDSEEESAQADYD